MAGKTLSYFNLTGGLNTVQTMATINSTTSRTESPEMYNIEYFKLSGLKTMNGNVVLNKGNEGTTQLNTLEDTNNITFGYEYIKGNNRYMIVSDLQNLYEYQPNVDRFNKIFSFDYNGKITICGYANGIVACCDNPSNDYLIYYQKNRNTDKQTGERISLGTASIAAGSTSLTLNDSNYIDSLGTGDFITINDTQYEIELVPPSSNVITLKTAATETYEGTEIYLTDLSLIHI